MVSIKLVAVVRQIKEEKEDNYLFVDFLKFTDKKLNCTCNSLFYRIFAL
jgi:hypothetical protein